LPQNFKNRNFMETKEDKSGGGQKRAREEVDDERPSKQLKIENKWPACKINTCEGACPVMVHLNCRNLHTVCVLCLQDACLAHSKTNEGDVVIEFNCPLCNDPKTTLTNEMDIFLPICHDVSFFARSFHIMCLFSL
jgi:hypothetical protein